MILKIGDTFQGYVIETQMDLEDGCEYREMYAAHTPDEDDEQHVFLTVYSLNDMPETMDTKQIREFQICSQLTSRAFPEFIKQGHGDIDGKPIAWMIQEYVQHQKLSDVVPMRVLSEDNILDLFCDILTGVKELSTRLDHGGHFNLNPDTVIVSDMDCDLDRDIQAYLIGLEHASEQCVGAPQFDTNTLDPYYRAKETYLGQYSTSSDIYSLGVLLAYMFCGEYPFYLNEFTTEKTIPDEVAKGRLPDEVPDGLKVIIYKAVSLSASMRYESIDELWNAIRTYRGEKIPDDKSKVCNEKKEPNKKCKITFWRVIVTILTVCVVLIVAMRLFFFVTEDWHRFAKGSIYNSTYLSSNIMYHPGNSYIDGYVFNKQTGKKITKGLDWLAISPNDSLAVICKNKRRGYLNAYTGKIVIPPTYAKAWIFSDGVAAVMENDSIYFINHAGKRIIHQGFEKSDFEDDYVFHDGYCNVKLHGKSGVIDKTGKVCVPIEYDEVKQREYGLWAVRLNDKWGVYNDSSVLIFPCAYRFVEFSEQNGIYLTNMQNYCRRYSSSGELLDNFVISEVDELMYDSQAVDADGNTVYKTAPCLRYKAPCGLYGLLGRDGHPFTAPLFTSIDAIGEDLFLGHYENGWYGVDGEGVLMNHKGEIMQVK
jgi:serine/threonine protein kinase